MSVVYLVLRQSPDCQSPMVEIMGACMEEKDAESLREYVFTTKGIRCRVARLHPELPKGEPNAKEA